MHSDEEIARAAKLAEEFGIALGVSCQAARERFSDKLRA